MNHVSPVSHPAESSIDSGMDTLVCVAIRPETPTVKTFTFQSEHGGAPAFEAGQAMTLAVEIDGELLYRTFSLSSSPARRDAVDVTIKTHPQGRVTRWLHERFEVGMRVRARAPRGTFTIARRSSDRIALISAGSGATPLMSMLRAMADAGAEADVAWFHSARTPDEVLFADELARLQQGFGRLSVAVTVSQPVPGWFGYRGRVSRRLLSVAVPDLGRRDVFCCGPQAFMDEVKLIHAAEGGDRARFHTESFGRGGTTAKPAVELPAASPLAGEATYRLRVGGREIQVGADETILQASLRQGVVIPCGCGEGMCGTCIVRKLSGEVVMAHQGGLSPEEEQAGHILACSTRLLSDAEIVI
jgi:ferredoxin-NADP reductase